jgi:hypothetical protein
LSPSRRRGVGPNQAGQESARGKQKEAVKQQLNLAEVAQLRQAYLLLNAANGDYAGHRAKAMNYLNQAIKILEVHIAQKGMPAQETENIRQEAVRAYYKSQRKNAPAVIEPQIISDAQVFQAGQLLGQLRLVLARNKQNVILGHVDQALGEIRKALAITRESPSRRGIDQSA